MGLLNDAYDLLVAVRGRDVLDAQVRQQCRQPAAKGDCINDPLPNQIWRQAGLRLNQPQPKVPCVLAVLALRVLAIPCGRRLHLEIYIAPCLSFI